MASGCSLLSILRIIIICHTIGENFIANEFYCLVMNAVADRCVVHTLYDDHHQWLNRWLVRRLCCVHDAADVLQDTYVRVISSGRLPGVPEEGRPFLMRIAKGLVIDLHRRRVLEQTYLDALAQLPDAYAPSAEEQELTLQLLVRIDQALDELPKRVREAFLQSRFEGLTYDDIAKQQRVSVGCVRKWMLKAALACLVAVDV